MKRKLIKSIVPKVSYKKSIRDYRINYFNQYLFVLTKDAFDTLTKVFEGFSLEFISKECNISIK
ncbi:uncharacterized protein BX663DRAFT_515144 [Cokeromyces recurvatus]|uniref:uncharacterized protein n=1 Tax=Cokeromyces recurvatus TaxID=90255 RepID=UPI00221F350C|nr:uncharacterized protein BX663DRAFT_515144 [Cokeromyces recurvatus]KAI7901159.1 hypothetical protein BX663DRAFT_515144 [Cokeromyces recurvatus]